MLNKADRACVQFLRASTSVRLIAENDSGDRVTISLNKRQQGGGIARYCTGAAEVFE